jgi:hypothetical protein
VLEGFLVERLGSALAAGWKPDADPTIRVADAVERVCLGADRIEIMLAPASLEHGVRIAGEKIGLLRGDWRPWRRGCGSPRVSGADSRAA